MKKSINLIFPLLFLLSGEPAASMQYISRANCFNNESITWDWKQASYPMISVTSMHRWNGLEPDVHSIDDIRHDDNAAKAIDWGEGMGLPGGPYWTVTGFHGWIDINEIFHYGMSSSSWCSSE